MKKFWLRISSKISIRTKLAVIFVVIAFIPLCVLGLLHVLELRTTLRGKAMSTLLEGADVTATKINTFLMSTSHNCIADSRLPLFANYLNLSRQEQNNPAKKTEVIAALRALGGRNNVFGISYSLLNLSGEVLVDTDFFSTGTLKKHCDFFKIPMATKSPYISGVVFAPKTGQGELFFSTPVYNRQNKVVGLFKAKISAGVLHSILARTQNFASSDSFAFLVDQNSIVLASGGMSHIVYQPLRKLSARVIAKLTDSGHYPTFTYSGRSLGLEKLARILEKTDEMSAGFEFEFNHGTKYFGAAARTDFLPWTIVFVRPASMFALPIKNMLVDTSAVGFMVLVLAVIFAFILARKLTSPVLKLAASAEEIAQGKLNTKIFDPVGSDELSVLARSVKSMQTMILQKISELNAESHRRTDTQSEFKKAQALLKTAVDQSLIGVVIAEPKYNKESGESTIAIKQINAEALRICGLDLPANNTKQLALADVASFPVKYFNDKNEPIDPHFLPVFEATLFSRTIVGQHIHVQRQDGSFVHTVVSATPVKDGAGNTIGGICAFMDISEMERMQSDLSMFRSIPDYVRFGIVVTNDQGSLIYANNFFCEMYGKTMQTIEKTQFTDFFNSSSAGKISELTTNLSADNNYQCLYLDLVRPDGSCFPCMITATYIKNAETHGGEIAYTIVDITEIKNVETMLIDAKKQAEDASVAKNRYLANISHEIRTPMNAIIGFSQILKQTAVDDEQDEYVDTIIDSGAMLLNLIDNILDISKIEAGQVKLQKREFYLLELLEGAIKIISHKFQTKDVELFYNIAPECPHSFEGDPDRIKQIFINLLTNAIKFTDHGRIDVLISSSPSRLGGQYACLNIRVKDSGVGIPANKLDSVFNVFEQAHTGTAQNYGGSGLGLAIVKNLVELMGGHISVMSELGKGSEFSFNLELVCNDLSPDPFICPNTLPASCNKAIIVVANPVLSRIIHTYASQAGLEIIGDFQDGADVFNWNETITPDIILCTKKTDNKALNSFITRLKTHYAGKPIKFILFSKNSDGLLAAKDSIKGHAVLLQPIIKSDFFKIIRYLIQSSVDLPELNAFGTQTTPDGSRVLLVDDNVNNRNLLALYLRGMCSLVKTATNGQEAIDLMKKTAFDVILMDVLMPRLDGIEATKIIRKDISADVPVIGITADLMESTRKAGLAAGMTDYIFKPVTREKLLETIRRWGVKL